MHMKGSDKVENHKRLESNIAQNAKSVKEYLSSKEKVAYTIDTALVQGILNKDLDNATIDNWMDEIKAKILFLQVAKDEKQDIKVTITDHQDGTKTMIRDAREASNADRDSLESAKIQQLNQIRGALLLLDQEIEKLKFLNKSTQIADSSNKVSDDQLKAAEKRVASAKKKLGTLANTAVNASVIDAKDYNTTIVNMLHDAGISNAGAKMEVAKEFSGMMQDQFHLTTLTKVENNHGIEYTKVESDVAALGLTDELKQQYLAVANHKNLLAPVKVGAVEVEWFNKLPFYQKQLVQKFAEQIADGKINIPTQLRTILPGIRNAYVKTTSVAEHDGSKVETVLQTNHMGTASFHSKHLSEEQNQEITNANVRQASEIFGDGTPIVMNILNSPVNPTGIDKSIQTRVQRAVSTLAEAGNKLVKSVTTPFNFLRMLSSNDNAEYNRILKEEIAGKLLQNINSKLIGDKSVSKIQHFLMTGRGYDQAKAEWEALPSGNEDQHKFKQLVANAITAKAYMQKWKIFYDPENTNLAISTEMKLLTDRLNRPSDIVKEGINRGHVNVSKIVSFCASGKDRTGVAETEATRKAVDERLGVKFDSIAAKENLRNQAHGGHTQTLAGLNGGTLGCHGIKKDTIGSFPKQAYKEVLYTIVQAPASNNKFKYDKKDAAKHHDSTSFTPLCHIDDAALTKVKLKPTPMHQASATTSKSDERDVVKDGVMSKKVQERKSVTIEGPGV